MTYFDSRQRRWNLSINCPYCFVKDSTRFRASIIRMTLDGNKRNVSDSKKAGINSATVANWTAQYKAGRLSMDDWLALTVVLLSCNAYTLLAVNDQSAKR